MKSFDWRAYALTAAATFLTVTLALISSLLAMTDTFPLTVELSPLLRLSLLSALGCALVYAVPRPSLRAGLVTMLLGLLALYVWWQWDSFSTGAQVLFHQVSYTFYEELPAVPYYDLPMTLTPLEMRQTAGVFLTAAVPLLALWLGPWLTLRWPVWPAVGTVAALVGMPLLLMRQPGAPALAAFLLFLSLVILSRRGYRENAAAGARRVLAAVVPAALVMALLFAAIPAETSPRPVWLEDLRLAFQRLPGEGFALGIGGPGTSTPGEQPFGSLGPLRFTGRTVLQINSSSTQNPLFLRGFSAGEYTAEGWMPIDDESDPYPLGWKTTQPPALFPWLTQPDRETDTIRITDLASPSNYYYLPYYPSALPGDAIMTDDAYLEHPSGVKEYHISFLAPKGTSPSATLSSSPAEAEYYSELEYRRWVYDHYLDVPYDLLSDDAAVLLNSFSASVISGADPVDVAHALKDYLASFTQYDQSAPYTPEGEDFVSYFLTESHRGYCVHYASAATLFLRACGVPARYAAGYVARPGRANAVTNIPDRNAHAWVEVYVDGFGWQPVDVTPGFSGGGNLGDLNAADPEVSPSPTPAPSAPTAAPTPTPPASSAAPSSRPGAAAPSRASFLLPLLILLCAGLLIGLVFLQALLRRAHLRKKCTQNDPNQAVLALYRYLLVLSRHGGADIPQEALRLAQKARFSQHILTAEERAAMEAMARTAARRAKALPFLRKLLLKYVWALI